ncbi:mannose-6-phosphate isomerase, class I [Rodentibacter pneumotropicus]|uniref:mannose-6-phosphate isomerase n=1 Tax=Rodentibacter pneumotropicus TaxID=758 RepID=A0AAW5LAC0_9PAST|nr:mannose-6-phosphate isomerase, class I [Rodentibacter pneumotropicus]MCQ9120380.1 mannose-6-phosphate isomerase, class I [Rodentibacter pneumotropicus]OOF66848.1 mannose-6-phosphate isomerase, class I [Rodentibacter pneumotropicus]
MIYKLTGVLQHYIWGGEHYIPQLLNLSAEENQHYAEWWLGAHTSAPAIIEVDDKSVALTEFLQQNPTALGDRSREIFGEELPYLLKILDVAKPLSIQLHPTKQQAEIGFAKENAAGIDLKDPKRTYKDNNHKPEMMIALSDFWLLHGFKKKEKILATLAERSSFTPLAEKLCTQDLHSFYADVMQADQSQLYQWLAPIIEQNYEAYAANELELENPDYWLFYSMEAMGISPEKLDAGLVCFYLFNIVRIKKGEGIYQEAGIPHAYLRGQNIELMACSDNVIRGGLTPKYVDIPELLKVVDCREVEPQIIPAAPHDVRVFTYSTPAKDFALQNIQYECGETHRLKIQSAGILMVMKGQINLRSETTALSLKQGESAFITSGSSYEIEGLLEGYAVVAKLP